MAAKYKQLTLKEIYQIDTLNKLGFSAGQLTLNLKQGNKTITEELALCLK